MTGILNEIALGFWMIDKQFANSYIHLVANLLNNNNIEDTGIGNAEQRLKNNPRFATFNNGAFKISEYSAAQSPENAPEDSIAIVNIHGAITYYDQACGPAGMSTKANLVDRIGKSPNIKAVIFELRSGGGEGYACDKLIRSIRNLDIPTVGFVEDIAASAAYKILAACDWAVANTPLARIGSIGTYVTIADFSKQLEMHGIKLTDIYATKSKDKNADYKEALQGNTTRLQKTVDAWNEVFLSEIKEFRSGSISPNESSWGSGDMFFANEALELGLIDEISSFNDVIKSLINTF